MQRRWFAYASRRAQLTDGVNDAWDVSTESVARQNSDISPYLIANEWICGHIANFLRLPIPPFAVVRKSKNHPPMFASLRFGSKDQPPNDAMPTACVQHQSMLCAGILAFDILVANSDRHVGNIKVDDPINPRHIDIFDHDRALFGCIKSEANRRLSQLLSRLAVTGGSVTGGNRHCFLDVLSASDHLRNWVDRIYTMPKWFIEDVCNNVSGRPVTRKMIETAIRFIDYRRLHLAEIIGNHRQEFRSIADWGLWA